MPIISDVVTIAAPGTGAAIPTNGVTINAYKATRLSGPPSLNTAPPGGAVDGTAVSGPTHGGVGAWRITVATDEDYYCLAPAYGAWFGPYASVENADLVHLAGAETITGAKVFSGPLSAKTLSAIRFADQFPGASVAAQIQAANDDLAGASGLVVIPSSMGAGFASSPGANTEFLDLRAGFGLSKGSGAVVQLPADVASRALDSAVLHNNATAESKSGALTALELTSSDSVFNGSAAQAYLRPNPGGNNGALWGTGGGWSTRDASGALSNTLDDGSGNATIKGKITAATFDKGGLLYNAASFAGIDMTGATDSLAGVNSALAIINTLGGGHLSFPFGTVSLSASPTTGISNLMVSGQGWGTKFVMTGSWTGTQGCWSTIGANKVRFKDFMIDCSPTGKASGLTFRGLYFRTANDCRADNVLVLNPSHAGVLIDGGCTNTKADNCYSNGTAPGGAGAGVKCNGFTIDINFGANKDSAFQNCAAISPGDSGFAAQDGATGWRITGCLADLSPTAIGQGIDLPGAQQGVCTGNVILLAAGTASNGILAHQNLNTYSVFDLAITGNTIIGPGSGTSVGILCISTVANPGDRIVIASNTIRGMGGPGIAVATEGQYIGIKTNTITGCGGDGIRLDQGVGNITNTSVVGNDCANNGGYGIYVHPSIVGCKVMVNDLVGNALGGTNAPLSQKQVQLQWFGNGPQDTDNVITGAVYTATGGVVSRNVLDDGGGNAAIAGTLTAKAHVLATGTTPTVAAGANNGTTPPAPTATGNDTRMTISCGSGTTPAAGAQIVVTFATAYAVAPVVTLTPANAATAALQPYVSSVTTAGYTLSTGIAPAASQAAGTYSASATVIG